MHNKTLITLLIGAVTTGLSGVALAQTPAPAPAPSRARRCSPPPRSRAPTTSISSAIRTIRRCSSSRRPGVIATDPISYGRPQAAKTYLEEIGKITKAPVKYLIYSHHHYDHIAGGKPFKDAGAKVVAHKRAKERLTVLKGLDVVIPDETVTASAPSSSAAPRWSWSTPGATIPIRRW